MDILDFLLVLYVIIIVASILFLVSTISRMMNKKSLINKKNKTFNTITESFCDGRFHFNPPLDSQTLDSQTIRRLFEVNKLYKLYDSFADFLDEYLVELLNNKDSRIKYDVVKEDNSDWRPRYTDIDVYLSKIINLEKEKKPFEGVEERVRKLLEDIKKASDNENSDEVSTSLNYLTNILIENQKIYSKENRRNSLLTKMGVIFTILSLVAAIIIFIVQNNKSLTSEVVKQNMVEVVDSSVVKDTINSVEYCLEFRGGKKQEP